MSEQSEEQKKQSAGADEQADANGGKVNASDAESDSGTSESTHSGAKSVKKRKKKKVDKKRSSVLEPLRAASDSSTSSASDDDWSSEAEYISYYRGLERGLRSATPAGERLVEARAKLDEYLNGEFDDESEKVYYEQTALANQGSAIVTRRTFELAIVERLGEFLQLAMPLWVAAVERSERSEGGTEILSTLATLTRVLDSSRGFYASIAPSQWPDGDAERALYAIDAEERDDEQVCNVRVRLSRAQKSVPVLYAKVANAFCRAGGLDRILALIADDEQPPSLVLMRALLKPLLMVNDFLAPGERTLAYVTQVRVAAFKRLRDIHLAPMSKSEKSVFKDVGMLVRELMLTHMDEADVQWRVDEFNLDVGHEFLQMQAIDKRLKGWRWIKRPLEYVTRKEKKAFSIGGFFRARDDDERPRIPAELVIDWYLERQLVRQLAQMVDYPELIRQGMPVAVFVASRAPERLHVESVCAVYNGTIGKHKADKRTILDALVTLLPELPLPALDALWATMQPTLDANMDAETLDFVRRFTAEALKRRAASAEADASLVLDEPGDAYGVDVLWKLVTEAGKPSDVKEPAVAAINELLRQPAAATLRLPLMRRALASIKAHRSVPAVLRLLRGALETFPVSKKRSKRTQAAVIEQLDAQDELSALLFADLADYHKRSVKAAARDTSGESLATRCLVHRTGVPHAEQVRARFDFVRFVFEASALQLNAAQLDALWHAFVDEPVCVEEREALFELLSAVCARRDALRSSARDALFSKRMLTLKPTELSPAAYALLERLFVETNEQASALRRVDDKYSAGLIASGVVAVVGDESRKLGDADERSVVYAHASELKGMEVLWRVFLEAEDESIVSRVMLFLNTLFQNLTPDSAKSGKLQKYRDAHVSRCLKRLNGSAAGRGADEERCAERCLRMLAQLLDTFAALEGRRQLEPSAQVLSQELQQQQLTITVRYDTGKVLQLLVSAADSIKLLRSKLAEQYEPADVPLRMTFARAELSAADNHKCVADLQIVDGATLFVAKRRDSDVEADTGVMEVFKSWGARLRGKRKTESVGGGGSGSLSASTSTAGSSGGSVVGLTKPSTSVANRNKLPGKQHEDMPPSLLGAMGQAQEPVTTMALRPAKKRAPIKPQAGDGEHDNVSWASLRTADDFPRGWPNHALATEQTFNMLFELLERDSIAGNVFRLLDHLPTSESMLSSLREFSDNWQALFDSKHRHRQLYAVRLLLHLRDVSLEDDEIIADMEHVELDDDALGVDQSTAAVVKRASNTLTATTIVDGDSWAAQLLQKGGLELLARCLAGLEVDGADQLQVMALVRAIDLFSLIQDDEALMPRFIKKRFARQMPSSLPLKLLQLMGRAASNELDRSDLPVARAVMRHGLRVLGALAMASSRAFKTLTQWAELERWLECTLLLCDDSGVRSAAAGGINALCRVRGGAMAAQLRVALLKLLPRATGDENNGARSAAYFDALCGALRALDRSGESGGEPAGDGSGDDEPASGGGGGAATATAAATAQPAGVSVDALFVDMVGQLLSHRSCETVTSDSPSDQSLVGLLECVRALVEVGGGALAQSPVVGADDGLLRSLFVDCLFEVADAENALTRDAPPKCKTESSRKAAFDLLLALARHSADNQAQLMALLDSHLGRISRSLEMHWGHSHLRKRKSSTGYVGLQNQGATCYMNSLMQQLFCVPQLRAAICAMDLGTPSAIRRRSRRSRAKDSESDKAKKPSAADKNRDSKQMLQQMQVLFANLRESLTRSFDTINFCRTLKDFDGQPINVSVQMDANEFYNMLFDKVDEYLRPTADKMLLRSMFGGELSNQLIPNGCGHTSERAEPFYSLGLEVKNKSDIGQSLDLFIEGEMLAGDNAYYCERCDERRDTRKRCCLKSLPNVLVINLKRFEFDYETMRNKKINARCAFPMELDLTDYTVEGVARNEALAHLHEANAALDNDDAAAADVGGDAGGDAAPAEDKSMRRSRAATVTDLSALVPLREDEYYQYELVGVTVHQGTADSGHYYSFVREREPPPGVQARASGEWFEFNDTSVSSFDPKDIADECFGGQLSHTRVDKATGESKTFSRDKANNAYILFYQRKKWFDEHGADEDEKSKSGGAVDGAADSGAAGGDAQGATSLDVPGGVPRVESDVGLYEKFRDNVNNDKDKDDDDDNDDDDDDDDDDYDDKNNNNNKKNKNENNDDDDKIDLNDEASVESAASEMDAERGNAAILKRVWVQNKQHLTERYVFNDQFFRFLWQLTANGQQPSAEAALKSTKLLQKFLFRILARSGECAQQMPYWIAHAQELLDGRVECCQWLLEAFSGERQSKMLFVEMLWECPVDAARTGLVSLLLHAMRVLGPTDSAYFVKRRKRAAGKQAADSVGAERSAGSADSSVDEEAVDEAAVLSLAVPKRATSSSGGGGGGAAKRVPSMAMLEFAMSLMAELRFNPRALRPMLTLLHGFALIGHRHRQLLLRRNTVGKLIDLFYGEHSFRAPSDSEIEAAQYASSVANGDVRVPRPEYLSAVRFSQWPVKSHWKAGIELVSLLVCCCGTDACKRAHEGDSHPPTMVLSSHGTLSLPAASKRGILRTSALDKWLSEKISTDDTVRILLHWMWNDRKQSQRVIAVLREGLESASKPLRLLPYLALLDGIFAIHDSLRGWRVDWAMCVFAKALDLQHGHRAVIQRLCEWLIGAVQQWHVVRIWCAQHVTILNELLFDSNFQIKI